MKPQISESLDPQLQLCKTNFLNMDHELVCFSHPIGWDPWKCDPDGVYKKEVNCWRFLHGCRVSNFVNGPKSGSRHTKNRR